MTETDGENLLMYSVIFSEINSLVTGVFSTMTGVSSAGTVVFSTACGFLNMSLRFGVSLDCGDKLPVGGVRGVGFGALGGGVVGAVLGATGTALFGAGAVRLSLSIFFLPATRCW
ncbi:hypothetical protein BFP72_06340 [Reichenbachiella sp. 5M10]|nr:hypothetical protein BFP72_06340 [Reichenbachiella sp. 5M10]